MKDEGVYSIWDNDKYGIKKTLNNERINDANFYSPMYSDHNRSLAAYKQQDKLGCFFEEKLCSKMRDYNRIVWKLNNIGEPVEKYGLFNNDTKEYTVNYGSYSSLSYHAFNCSFSNFNGYLRSSVSNLLSFADKLGYVVIPVDVLNKDTISPSYNFGRKLEAFKKNLKTSDFVWKLFAMCPINYIDLLAVVASEKMPRLYFSPDLSIYETNLSMTLPVFRTLYSATSVLSDDVQEIKERLNKIEGANREKAKTEVNSLQNALKNAADANAKSKGGYKSLYDSVLVFAVSINDDTDNMPTWAEILAKYSPTVNVGFGFGTEFDDDFANKFGVKNNGITKKSTIIL